MVNYLDYFNFEGKVACVTGAASGIGQETATLLSQLGATVIAADRNMPGLRDAHRDNPNIELFEFDQGDLSSVNDLGQHAAHADILVNNAGVLLFSKLSDMNWDDMRRVVDVNILGAFALTQIIGSKMAERKTGAITMTGSQSAYNGSEYRAVYAATKAAVAQFIKTAALEWGPDGVRVNCIAPGRTLTNMNRHLLTDPKDIEEGLKRIPLGRFGHTRDIADAIVFLVSDASSYMTGQTLIVDGGWLLP